MKKIRFHEWKKRTQEKTSIKHYNISRVVLEISEDVKKKQAKILLFDQQFDAGYKYKVQSGQLGSECEFFLLFFIAAEKQ